MQTIQYLISKLVLIIVVLALFGVLYFMAKLLVPFLPKTIGLSRGEKATTTDNEFWLPAPGSFSTRVGIQNDYPYGRPLDESEFLIYKPENSYSGNNPPPVWPKSDQPVQQMPYAPTTVGQGSQVFDPIRAGFAQNVYMRSLSVYAGMRVYPGFTFTGEATQPMFSNGKFMVYVIDPRGNIVGGGEGRAGAVQGNWVRFTARILTPITYTGASCTLALQQIQPNGIRITLPVNCN